MSAGDTSIAAVDAGPPAARARPPAAKARSGWLWQVLPAAAAIAAVSLFPIAYALFLSLQSAPTGFESLRADPVFWEALRRTLTIAGIALPVELLLGLALAGILAGRMPGRGLFVSLLVLPALLAPAISGSAWRMLLDNDYGPINHMLGWVTGGAVMTLWTQDPQYATRAVLIADIWQWTPFMCVLMLAALTSASRGQREAAEIDDAGPWRTFSTLVMPALWPAIGIAVVIRGFDLLRLFDVVWVLTRGGPEQKTETLSVLAYERLLDGANGGSTAAMAFSVMFGVSLVGALLLAGLGRER